MHETVADNLPVRMYVNKKGNRVTFKIKTVRHLELLMLETIKLLGSTKNNITKDENDAKILDTFFPNISFDQLLDISRKSFIFLKTFNSEFSYIEVWLTDQNSKPLEMEDKISTTLIIR